MTTVSVNQPASIVSFPYVFQTGQVVYTNCKSGKEFVRNSSGANRPKKAYVKQYYVYKNSRNLLKTKAGKTTVTVVHYSKVTKYRKLTSDPSVHAVPNPYTLSLRRAFWHPYAAEWLSYGSREGSWNNHNETWLYKSQASFTANDQIALVNRLQEKVRGNGFDPGVFAAELPQACLMITNAATRIFKAYSSFKKGRSIDAWNHLTESKPYKKFGVTQSSNWLELQYGWLPLLSDAHDGAQYLAHHLSELPKVKKYRVNLRKDSVMLSPSSPGSEGFGISSHFIRRSIIANIEEGVKPTLTGMIDPLTITWELMPYSFVVDWFIPIGNYLSARGFANSLKGTFITSTLEKRKGSDFKRVNQASGGTTYSKGILNCEIVNFSRSISTSLALDMPQVKPLSGVASWKRAANAVALLTQNFRR